MDGEVIHLDNGAYVRCAPGNGLMASEQDLLDLLSSCYEAGANRVLLEQDRLHPDFFDLKTGVAGALFHKLTTYQVKTAVLLSPTFPLNDRFQELVRECNRRGAIHFFYELPPAETWLCA